MSLKPYSSRDEALKSTLLRWKLNYSPAYFSTAAKITFLSGDYQEVHVKIPLNWRTRDQSGNLFRGTQYAAVDPIYRMILKRNLGKGFRVRDDNSRIRFREPCDQTVRAKFEINDEELERIRNELDHHESVVRVYKVELTGENETVFTEIEQTFTISEA